MFVVLVNGPPRSGKDTVGDELVRNLRSARKFKFAEPVKDGTHASFGLRVPTDFFEEVKDVPRHEFGGITPRQAYINHAEKYMRALYGRKIYGRLLANKLLHFMQKERSFTFAVITDCGFLDECEELAELVGPQKMALVRVYRPGCNFNNDSRSYIEEGPYTAMTFYNDNTIDTMRQRAVMLAKDIASLN